MKLTKHFQPKNPKVFRLQVIIIVISALLVSAVSAATVFGFSQAAPQPGVELPDSSTNPPAEDEASIDESDDDDEELQAIRETFADEVKIKKETETLIDEMDEAITAMDLLIKKANQTSNEGCELLQVYLEIDQLKLLIKRDGAGWRLENFVKAVEAGILGEEFLWEVEEETLGEDFNFTALDESVLGDDFNDAATPAGKALRTEIIKIRQRQRKIVDQAFRLEVIDERQALIDPACKPIFH